MLHFYWYLSSLIDYTPKIDNQKIFLCVFEYIIGFSIQFYKIIHGISLLHVVLVLWMLILGSSAHEYKEIIDDTSRSVFVYNI